MAAALNEVRYDNNAMGADYFKVEEEVVFSGGGVGKSRKVAAESSIEDLLSQNLVSSRKVS